MSKTVLRINKNILLLRKNDKIKIHMKIYRLLDSLVV